MAEATHGQLGVVFVHGILSSPATWDRFRRLIDDDDELQAVTPLCFEYVSRLVSLSPARRIPSLDDIASHLRQFLHQGEAAGFQRLALVGHSQGGLVIQRYLVQMLGEGRGNQLTRIHRIVFFACPNYGSDFVRSLRRWWLVHPQERHLRPFNDEVNRVHRTMLAQIVFAQEATATTCPIPIVAYAGEQDNIVTTASAFDGFPEALHLPGSHSGIIRPDTRQHPSYSALKQHLNLASGMLVGETIDTIEPASLGIHNAVLPEGNPSYPASLTPYLPRRHDRELYDVLESAVNGGQSVLAMLTGDSSTGKTRALYEAITRLACDRLLLRPATVQDLINFIDDGQITKRTVLWLNETERFLDRAEGEDAAAKLQRLLERNPGLVAVGAMWRSDWDQLTDRGERGDPHGRVRDLLHGPRTRRIRVPVNLSTEDRQRWRDLTEQSGDPRLAQALEAGKGEGRVVQHLAGGPELLAAYLDGPGEHFTHQEHALITAALDARRLGLRAPLSAVLLAEAAEGALAARYRSSDPAWAELALEALCAGERRDGRRTDIRRTLTAITASRIRSGAEAVYDPADYLDQQTRALRAGELGSPSLWEALTAHATDPDDVGRLASAAKKHGLYKQAVRLGRRAVVAGNYRAPSNLVRLLGAALDPHHHGAQWVATRADLTRPVGVAMLLDALGWVGADNAARTLLARDPFSSAECTDPKRVALLLDALRRANVDSEAMTLVDRMVARADLTDPQGVATLLDALRKVGADQAIRSLLDRDSVVIADMADPQGMAMLLDALRRADADEAVVALADRAVGRADVSQPVGVAMLLDALRKAGADRAFSALADRVVAQADLADAEGAAMLLDALRKAGADRAFSALADRVVPQVDLADARGAARLLDALGKGNAGQALLTLAVDRAVTQADLAEPQRAAALFNALRHANADRGAIALTVHWVVVVADLTDARGITNLLAALRKVGAGQAVQTLLDRNPAAYADFADPEAISGLLNQLRKAGDDQGLKNLLDRHPGAHVDTTHPQSVAGMLHALRKAGAGEEVQILLDRDPAAKVRLHHKEGVSRLVAALREVGANQAADSLAQRVAKPEAEANRDGIHGAYGREVDGRPAAAWTWNDVPFPNEDVSR